MKTLTKPFTRSWWKEFLITNKNFTQTCVIKNIIDEELLEDLNEGVMEVLRERFRLEHMGEGFRAYIDNIEKTTPMF